MDLKKSWVGEEADIKLWPQLYLTDITRFYSGLGIIQRIEFKYKQGDAYCYFKNNFVSKVFINNLNSESKYSFLKTKCLLSLRVSSQNSMTFGPH